MKNTMGWYVSAAIALLGLCTSVHASQGAAKAVIHDATGKQVGHATLKPGSQGVTLVEVTVTGLPAGTHAVHIHEVGKCEAPDFKSAGGHFNPSGKHHGHQNPQGAHAGDLPNLVVGKDGKGKLSWVTRDMTLAEGTENSIFHSGGTAVVIHAQPDDNMSDPAGNAGGRIACGVVEK